MCPLNTTAPTSSLLVLRAAKCAELLNDWATREMDDAAAYFSSDVAAFTATVKSLGIVAADHHFAESMPLIYGGDSLSVYVSRAVEDALRAIGDLERALEKVQPADANPPDTVDELLIPSEDEMGNCRRKLRLINSALGLPSHMLDA
jgi:hypothetical protein